MDLDKALPGTPVEVATVRLGLPRSFLAFLPALIPSTMLVAKGLTGMFTHEWPNDSYNTYLGLALLIGVSLLLLVAMTFAASLFGSIRAGRDGIVVKRSFRRPRFISWRQIVDAKVEKGPVLLLALRSASGAPFREEKFMVRNQEQLEEIVGGYRALLNWFRSGGSPQSVVDTGVSASVYRDPSIATERLWELAGDVREDKENRLRAADVLCERINPADRDAASFRARIDEIAEESVDESFTKELRARALGVQK